MHFHALGEISNKLVLTMWRKIDKGVRHQATLGIRWQERFMYKMKRKKM